MEVTKEDIELLGKIADYESQMSEYEKSIGWRWDNIGVYPATIHRLLIKGLVRVSYKSRSGTNYTLTELGKTALETGITPAPMVEEAPTPVLDVAQMFSDIVGYDDIKELLRESLQLEKAIHILLWGPPSLAKSMFLWDIEEAFGQAALPLLGSATSHAGLWDLVVEKRPRVLLVDEVEKMTLTDMAGLLSLMQTGRIIRAKVGRKLDERLNTWVIAAANRIGKLPPELLSRFAKFQLEEYTATEYAHVVESVLVHHEDTGQEDAHEIAMRLVGRTHDVRDAVRVARLAKRVGVKRSVELLLR